MFSHAGEEDVALGTNRAETELGNSTHRDYSPHYAAQYPYTILNESFLRHLINFTSETMQMGFGNATNTKRNQVDNDTFNYEECGVTHDNESAWFSFEFQATVHFMYITILLIAIFGNGIVCFIVISSSRMQTVTNFFIANLALSDMLMALFCIPFSFISLFVLQ
jgi:7 transmembrane receptor (rhodopsin family)